MRRPGWGLCFLQLLQGAVPVSMSLLLAEAAGDCTPFGDGVPDFLECEDQKQLQGARLIQPSPLKPTTTVIGVQDLGPTTLPPVPEKADSGFSNAQAVALNMGNGTWASHAEFFAVWSGLPAKMTQEVAHARDRLLSSTAHLYQIVATSRSSMGLTLVLILTVGALLLIVSGSFHGVPPVQGGSLHTPDGAFPAEVQAKQASVSTASLGHARMISQGAESWMPNPTPQGTSRMVAEPRASEAGAGCGSRGSGPRASDAGGICCPGYMVPEHAECILVVPQLQVRSSEEMPITDLSGNVILRAVMVHSKERMPTPDPHSGVVPMGGPTVGAIGCQLKSKMGKVIGACWYSNEAKCVNIYSDKNLYGLLQPLPFHDTDYEVFRAGGRELKLRSLNAPVGKKWSILDELDQAVGEAERPEWGHALVKIGPGIDAGLVVLGLLGIELLQAAAPARSSLTDARTSPAAGGAAPSTLPAMSLPPTSGAWAARPSGGSLVGMRLSSERVNPWTPGPWTPRPG